MSVLELDRIEARGDPGGPVLVPGEEDVLGQFARSESDVVLPFPFRDRDAAVTGVFDAGFRVRQDLSSLTFPASLARNSGEDSPAILRASSTATHDSCVREPRSATLGRPQSTLPGRVAAGASSGTPAGSPGQGRQTSGHAGSEEPPTVPSTQDGHAHRTDGDRQQASQPCTGTGQ